MNRDLSENQRIFVLSPARCDGARARLVLEPRFSFALAESLRSERGATIGETFSFLSGLYFRGKLAYAEAFARSVADIRVITTDRGLVSPRERITVDDIRAFSTVDIAAGDERYLAPLVRDVERLGRRAPSADIVLLGSIATGKYADALVGVFGERLVFPAEFVGRGDMSRGGLLLRSVADQRELEYIPVVGSVRRGSRPPKLAPLRRQKP